MLADAFAAGGPVMFLVLGTWIVVLAGVLDRGLYAIGRMARRPAARALAMDARGDAREARAYLASERARSARGLGRIDAVSKLATSVGLFGTVLGLAQTFFQRGGDDLALAAPEALADGLSTALFTTIAGLVVFLFGQVFLIVYDEWIGWCERGLAAWSFEGARA